MSKFPYPFNKWDKEKIENLIKSNRFKFDGEYGGILSFYYDENKFQNSYLLYLQRTGMYICNPNLCVKSGIKSYKHLNTLLQELYNSRLNQ